MNLPRLLVVGLVFGCCAPALAQLRPAGEGDGYEDAAPAQTIPFRVGVIINAKRGACRDIRAMVAVPIECDEQTVKLVNEEFSPQVGGVEFRDLAGGNARQMLVSIPYLKSGEEARAVLTYEVTTRITPPLEDDVTAELSIPRRVPRGLRAYVGPSPYIESKHPKIKRLARQIQRDLDESAEAAGEAEPNDWTRLETVYDYVLDTIEYLEGPDTSALTTLAEQSADCHGRSALFTALARATGVPARLVWVQDHCYPEFYLERPDGEGVWLPAESAGTRAFGEMPMARTIMQKGDDFRVPERPHESLRYASDFLVALPATKGAGKPSVKYIREEAQ
ncbi:MAG: transglutaminase-like domain-containing protein [Planctomycetota bacterium]